MSNAEILIVSFNIYPIAKNLLLVFLLIYLFIAILVIKQINLMTHTVNSGSNKYLYILAYIHLAIVITTLIFSFISL